jgi:hypothetical protein
VAGCCSSAAPAAAAGGIVPTEPVPHDITATDYQSWKQTMEQVIKKRAGGLWSGSVQPVFHRQE